MLTYLTTGNANAGRGTYTWANQTATRVEQARERLREFLDDPRPDRSTVHFVSGTTEGLRAVARNWLTTYLSDGDEIIVPYADHSANTLPWLEAVHLLELRGVRVTVHAMPYDAAHDYDVARLAAMITGRTRFVAATHVHHVYGGDMNLARLRAATGPDATLLEELRTSHSCRWNRCRGDGR